MTASGTGAGQRVVVIAGMHRSGTSLAASFLQARGLDVGSRLNPPDANNPHGYFEDLDFVQWHEAVFRAACDPTAPGWREVGWTTSGRMDPEALSAHEAAARTLIARRAGLPSWGFKDPRTTMVLPFWDALLPEARYLLVYRRPWDVVDSLLRAGHAALAERPDFALAIWAAYNERLLAFHRDRPGRCLLVSAEAMVDALPTFAQLLGSRLGLGEATTDAVAAMSALVDPAMLRRLPPAHPLVSLYRTHHPEAIALLSDLDAAADMPGPPIGPRATAASAIAGLHEEAIGASRDLAASRAACELATREAVVLEKAMARLAAERDDALAARATAEAAHAAAEAALIAAGATLAEAEGALRATRASTSWRLTAPLRALGRLRRGPGA